MFRPTWEINRQDNTLSDTGLSPSMAGPFLIPSPRILFSDLPRNLLISNVYSHNPMIAKITVMTLS